MILISFLVILKMSIALGGDSIVEYFIFNRNLPTGKVKFSSKLVNGSQPLKFLIHGWGENSDRSYYTDFTREYLRHGHYDIVHVDWKADASLPYAAAAAKTKDVGHHVAALILSLDVGVLGNVHLIGHSLGAHVAAHAGKAVLESTGDKLGRISGLDPAGPHFDVSPMDRLARADAQFVDVTHTDGNFFGLAMPIGHVDFYPNGGTRPQPGCELFNPIKYAMNAAQIGFCSHTRSYQLFIASINQPPMRAVQCDTYANFKKNLCVNNAQIVYGEFADRTAMGTFFFDAPQITGLPALTRVPWGFK